MAKEKALILAVLIGLILLSQGVARAEKGGSKAQSVTVPSANLGLAAVPAVRSSVGLPAGALAAPGAARSVSSAGLLPPGAAQSKSSAGLTPPGAIRSASSAGAAVPGQSDSANRGSSNEKSGESKEKLAASAQASTSDPSDREARLSQLPTCR